MAGDNVATVDLTELSLPGLTELKKGFDIQVDFFGFCLQQLKILQKEYDDSRERCERMISMKEGKSLPVPLTDSMYASGELDVEKEHPDAIDDFKRKVEFVTTEIEKVQYILEQRVIAQKIVIEAMEAKIQATPAAQQAAAAGKS